MTSGIGSLAELEASVGIEGKLDLLPFLNGTAQLFLHIIHHRLAKEYASLGYICRISCNNRNIFTNSEITFGNYAEHCGRSPVIPYLHSCRTGNHRGIGLGIIKGVKIFRDIGIARDGRDYLVVIYDRNLVAEKGERCLGLCPHDHIASKTAYEGGADPLVCAFKHSIGKKEKSHTQGNKGA